MRVSFDSAWGILLVILLISGGCSTTIGDVTGPHPEPVRADELDEITQFPQTVIIVQVGDASPETTSAVEDVSAVYEGARVLETPARVLPSWSALDEYLRDLGLDESPAQRVVLIGSEPNEDNLAEVGAALSAVTEREKGLIVLAPCQSQPADDASQAEEGAIAKLAARLTDRTAAEPRATVAECAELADALRSFEDKPGDADFVFVSPFASSR